MARPQRSIIADYVQGNPMPLPPWPNPVMSPYWHLALVPQELWDVDKDAWGYELDFLGISGGKNQLRFAPILLDGGYLLTGLSALVTTTANPPVIVWPQTGVANSPSNYLIQLTAVKDRYDFFSQPAPLDNVSGAGPSSMGIPVPVWLKSGEVLNVRLQSLWGVNTSHNVRITLTGAAMR